MYKSSFPVSSLSMLTKGDHISFQHSSYDQHAIVADVSDRELVVIGLMNPPCIPGCNHDTHDARPNIVMKAYPAEQFQSQAVTQYILLSERPYDADTVVKIATDVKEGKIRWDVHCRTVNHGEYFALWCTSGVTYSQGIVLV